MNYKFIWDINKDKIYLVDDFDSSETPQEDYITGEYSDLNKTVTLYGKSVPVPVNLDYFVRLWNASEPDKFIPRRRLLVKGAMTLQMIGSKKYAASNDIDELVKFLREHPEYNDRIKHILNANPTPETLRGFFSPIVVLYNKSIYDKTEALGVPTNPNDWKEMEEEDVFNYVNQFVKETESTLDPIGRSQYVEELMDRWYRNGVPIDPSNETIDEATIDWSKMLKILQSNSIVSYSKWKKVSEHQGWTNYETWEVNLHLQNDYETTKFFWNSIIDGMTLDQFINEAIIRVVGPLNRQLQEDFNAISDEEEIEMIKKHDQEKWWKDAEWKFPDDIEAQQEHVDQMERLLYSIMGEPEPTDIANHWIDESKINWEEIYEHWQSDIEAEDRQKYSKWKVSK